jgi:hypothetical protein
MEGMVFAVLTAVLAAVGIASLKWGVDSRDGSVDPRRSQYPVGIR